MLTRRGVLKWATASAMAMGLRPLRQQGVAQAATTPGRPRFYLQLIPSGGVDSVYGPDPRTAKEVEKGIDVPYPAKDIVTTSKTRLGPAFAALAPVMDRIAIVNGVRQNSANHHSGLVHTTCMRLTALPGTPTLLEHLGARRHGEATGSVSMGFKYATAFTPKYLGSPSGQYFGEQPGVFEHLDQLDGDDLAAAARALRREAKSLHSVEGRDATTATNLDDSAALLERWAKSPKFSASEWALTTTKLAMQDMESTPRDVQRALWMFENGLTRCATISFGEYDSHVRNHAHQSRKVPFLASLIARLIKELDSRIVDGQPLSAQTAVVIGSEIGRFPRLNVGLGKDHFSQSSWLFVGPWFTGGTTYGASNREMMSLPVALSSGKSDKGGHLVDVEDVGTTLMTLDGAKPGLFGYAGEQLSFLMR